MSARYLAPLLLLLGACNGDDPPELLAGTVEASTDQPDNIDDVAMGGSGAFVAILEATEDYAGTWDLDYETTGDVAEVTLSDDAIDVVDGGASFVDVTFRLTDDACGPYGVTVVFTMDQTETAAGVSGVPYNEVEMRPESNGCD